MYVIRVITHSDKIKWILDEGDDYFGSTIGLISDFSNAYKFTDDDIAKMYIQKILNDEQYEHIKDQIKSYEIIELEIQIGKVVYSC